MNVNPVLYAADAVDGETDDICRAPGAENTRQSVEPVVRIREEHNISRRDIDPDALKVLYRLARNNYIAYLVGGGVRDLLLGRKPKDFDVSTNARPEQIRSLFKNCILIGRRFRLAHIRYGDKIIETSTFRRTPECAADPDDPEADLFQRDDNLFGSPEEDALRRDFTVNGLFYDIETFSIIDYVGGMEDLALRRIRCIGNPCIRFREDPVRMVRAVRFASRLDFTLDTETLDAIRDHGEELAKAAPARLLEEICRLFAFSSGEKAMRLLYSTGLMRVILPEVAGCLDNPSTDNEPFWRRLKALDDGDTVLPDATPALIFAILLLEPLRAHMGRDWAADGFPRLKFDKAHAFINPLAQRLRFPRKLVDRIVHMYLAQHRFANTGGKRGSIANFVTQDSFHESLALAEIILTAESKSQTCLNKWRDMLAERIYGREEGSPERRNAHHAPAQGEKAPETAVVLDEPPQGKKLSRSARRRRNKKLKRMQRHEEEASAPNETVASAEPVNPEPQTAVEKPARIRREQEDQETTKPAKSRSRRARGRKKAGHVEEEAATTVAPPPRETPAANADVPVKPLTAAAFYTLPEPEPEQEPEKAKKPGRRKSSAKKTAKAKEAEPAEPAPEKPEARERLRMDLADEADIPMHWLDEI